MTPTLRTTLCAVPTRRLAPVVVLGAFVALGALSALVLSGCARPEADREASVGNKGTRLCITNHTSSPMLVEFTHADSSTGTGQVTRGGTACAQGTFVTGWDLYGNLKVVSTTGTVIPVDLGANNPWMGAPHIFMLGYQDGIRSGYICTEEGWDVNESHTLTQDLIAIDATRLADDDDWKEFSAVVRDTNSPGNMTPVNTIKEDC